MPSFFSILDTLQAFPFSALHRLGRLEHGIRRYSPTTAGHHACVP